MNLTLLNDLVVAPPGADSVGTLWPCPVADTAISVSHRGCCTIDVVEALKVVVAVAVAAVAPIAAAIVRLAKARCAATGELLSSGGGRRERAI